MPVSPQAHILAGAIAIVAGYVALFAAKGGRVHRRGGALFVGSMVVMGLSGAGIAVARGVEGSVTGGVLAAYLVVTALTTVRPPTAASRRVDRAAMLVALAAGVANLALVAATLAGGAVQRDGVPVPMFVIFATVALLASAGDLRVMRAGGVRGTPRLARHLWRMCLALWIATGSFFLGQADELPETIRIFPLLAIPAFAPLPAMGWWLWRVRRGRPDRGAVATRASAMAVEGTRPVARAG